MEYLVALVPAHPPSILRDMKYVVALVHAHLLLLRDMDQVLESAHPPSVTHVGVAFEIPKINLM